MKAAHTGSNSRLAFLDWTRGLAALIMLQGHVFHSFADKNVRNDGPYVLSQFVGGITPAVFLFLTGVTLAFLMDSRAKAGIDAGGRVLAALRRAGYLALVAFLFRLQLWLFAAGQSPWTDLFKVDILNCMALGLAAMAPLAVFETRERVRHSLIVGLAIAVVSPVISSLHWSGLHPFLQHYFVPDPNFFTFFPWAAFLAFGVSAGSILRLAPQDQLPRVMQWAAATGIVLLFGAQYFSNLPYSLYPQSDFWINSPALILMKVGIILLIASFAFLWTRYANPTGWSFVRQLGTTSLIVYWVHTELVYGRWFGTWKESLGVPQAALAAMSVVALMVGVSVARTGWRGNPSLFTVVRRSLQPAPEPAAGD
jgi:uncharacterized membrane protein